MFFGGYRLKERKKKEKSRKGKINQTMVFIFFGDVVLAIDV